MQNENEEQKTQQKDFKICEEITSDLLSDLSCEFIENEQGVCFLNFTFDTEHTSKFIEDLTYNLDQGTVVWYTDEHEVSLHRIQENIYLGYN